MPDEYRFVGERHIHKGEPLSDDAILPEDELPSGILRDYPHKFVKVGSDQDEADLDAEIDAEAHDPGEIEDAAADALSDEDEEPEESDGESGGEGTEADAEAEAEDDAEEPEVDPDEDYTSDEMEAMTRYQRIQLAKNAGIDRIDGRSSDDDIIAALATDIDDPEDFGDN